VRDELIGHGILAGVPAPWVGEDVLLVAVTERRDRGEIDRFTDAMREVLT
jgi:glycine cleavage system protein P-like pyridoxal-binding family